MAAFSALGSFASVFSRRNRDYARAHPSIVAPAMINNHKRHFYPERYRAAIATSADLSRALTRSSRTKKPPASGAREEKSSITTARRLFTWFWVQRDPPRGPRFTERSDSARRSFTTRLPACRNQCVPRPDNLRLLLISPLRHARRRAKRISDPRSSLILIPSLPPSLSLSLLR